jgi:hypothetical protein
MAITFGSFDGVCETAALVVCPLLGPDQGIEPVCYSRNVDIGGTLVFQPCTSTVSSFLLLPPVLHTVVALLWLRRLAAWLLVSIDTHVVLSPDSNMFRSCRGDIHDCDYDLPHPEQIHCRWQVLFTLY